jgi:hypothetical protein
MSSEEKECSACGRKGTKLVKVAGFLICDDAKDCVNEFDKESKNE